MGKHRSREIYLVEPSAWSNPGFNTWSQKPPSRRPTLSSSSPGGGSGEPKTGYRIAQVSIPTGHPGSKGELLRWQEKEVSVWVQVKTTRLSPRLSRFKLGSKALPRMITHNRTVSAAFQTLYKVLGSKIQYRCIHLLSKQCVWK
jgi:hypothetical protein